MKLYNHVFKASLKKKKIKIEKVEAIETSKTYKSLNGELLNYKKILNKNELNKTIESYGTFYMTSTDNNKNIFIEQIKNICNERIEQYEKLVQKYNNYISDLEDCEVESNE